MEYQEIATDDIDQLFTWTSGYDSELMQLSPGHLGFRCGIVELPSVSVRWNSFDQSVLVRQVLAARGVVFGRVLDSTGPVSVRGVDVAKDDGFVFQYGVEHEYRVPRSTNSLIIGIEPSFFQRLGWDLSPHAMRRVPRPLLDRLVTVCQDVTAAAARQPGVGVALHVALLRDRVIAALRNALEPWISQRHSKDVPSITPSRQFLLVKRAEQIMQSIDVDQKLSVPDLAAELGTSERNLYESFHKWLGIGPYEFHLRCRLHQFRKSLLTGKPYHGKIMRSAHLAGFQHMGRTTQAFRELFGETPREMVKRRSVGPR